MFRLKPEKYERCFVFYLPMFWLRTYRVADCCEKQKKLLIRSFVRFLLDAKRILSPLSLYRNMTDRSLGSPRLFERTVGRSPAIARWLEFKIAVGQKANECRGRWCLLAHGRRLLLVKRWCQCPFLLVPGFRCKLRRPPSFKRNGTILYISCFIRLSGFRFDFSFVLCKKK